MITAREPRGTQLALFAAINIAAAWVIGLPFLRKALSDGASAGANILMYLSSITALSLGAFSILFLAALLRPSRTALIAAAAAVGSLLHLFLLIDQRIFAVFKFHINGLILNFLTTEGAGDSLSLGTATLATYGAVLLGVAGAETVLAHWLFRRPFAMPGRRAGALFALAAFVLIAADKAVFAAADLTNKTSVLAYARYYPYYAKVTIKSFAERRFGYKVDREEGLSFSDAGKTLNYPLEPLKFAAGAPRPNILFLIVDGFRSDMLTPEVMPFLVRYAEANVLFRNHYSGGNGTRFGLFSLLYGMYGNLWHNFLEVRRGPVLMDALIERGYGFRVLASTRLTYPEFRKTIFVRVPDAITDEHADKRSSARDKALVGLFGEFLDDRDRKRPFFGFLFFNSSHQYYDYPPQFRKFTPTASDEVNFAKDIEGEELAGLKNRYKNSLVYIDSLIAQTVALLERKGLADNTIVVVTGDHGEEFKENGYFTHNSAFDDYQIKTPLVMRVPGVKPRGVDRPTSHLDVAPTLLNLLGCATPPAAFSHGRDLLRTGNGEYIVSTDWDSGAIVTPQHRLVFPITSGWKAQTLELRTAGDYRLIEDRELMNKYRPAILDVTKGMAAFLR